MAAYFECQHAADGQFVFNLKAGNHEVILSSELYTTKAACLAGIDSVRKNAAQEARFERRVAKDGSNYFVLLATNHQVLGRSEMYPSLGVKSSNPAASFERLSSS